MSSSRRRRWPRGRQGDQQDSASTPGGDSGQDDAFHLPGFYYDASQRRYFRLMPGQNGHNPLTLASIEAKLSDKNCRRVVESSLRRSGNTALPQSLSRMQMGLLPVDSFVASVQRVRMASLRGTLQAQIEDGGECTFLSGFCESGSTVVVGAWALETEGGRRVSVLRCVDVGNPTKPGLQTLASQPLHKVMEVQSQYCLSVLTPYIAVPLQLEGRPMLLAWNAKHKFYNVKRLDFCHLVCGLAMKAHSLWSSVKTASCFLWEHTVVM